jgi:hypothetical protein
MALCRFAFCLSIPTRACRSRAIPFQGLSATGFGGERTRRHHPEETLNDLQALQQGVAGQA